MGRVPIFSAVALCLRAAPRSRSAIKRRWRGLTMNKIALLVCGLMILAACPLRQAAAQDTSQEIARWKAEAQAVTIYRENWGIPHVYGKTNADAAFGMEYAQAELDFNRVEMNYIGALGWQSKFAGEAAIYADLRRQLYKIGFAPAS